MFSSRWPKKLPMHPGWMLASEVVRASCDTPDGVYQFEEVLLPARGPQYWDGRATHCPQITKIDDKYVLFYTGITHPFTEPELPLTSLDPRVLISRSNKRTGIAVSDSVFVPWQRFDKPIIDTRPDEYDNFLISNAAPCRCPDGKILVVYKNLEYMEQPFNCPPDYKRTVHKGIQRLGAVIADRFDGDYTLNRLNEPILQHVEDPFIWYDEDGYNMMTKDMTGDLCGELMGGLHGISKDGFHWEFDKGNLFYSRKILWDDGITREMGNLDRPFILFEDGKPAYAFFATSDGTDGMGFENATRTWNMVVPLKF